MNKFAKGSLAAGAGIVLLLGGAGTLAYWNDSAELTGGTVNAGTLELNENDDTLAVAGPELLVPGDTKTFTADMQLIATGDNIQGTVSLDHETKDLLTDLKKTYDVSVTFGDATSPAGSAVGEFDVDKVTEDTPFPSAEFVGAGEYTFPVTIKVTLPFGDDPVNDAKGVKLSMETVKLTATQTPAAGAN